MPHWLLFVDWWFHHGPNAHLFRFWLHHLTVRPGGSCVNNVCPD